MLTNKKILLADDETGMRMMAKLGLEKFGHASVKEAIDGRALVDLAVKEMKEGRPFDFILSDYNMPNLRGVAAIKEIKNLYPSMNLPGLIMTGNANDLRTDGISSMQVPNLDRELYQIQDIDGLYLMTKPFYPATLIKNISYILNQE